MSDYSSNDKRSKTTAGILTDSQRFCSHHYGKGSIEGGYMKHIGNGRGRFICGKCAERIKSREKLKAAA